MPMKPEEVPFSSELDAFIEKRKKGDREDIVISEIPFQVNKARLIEEDCRAGAGEKDRGHCRCAR